MKPANFLLCCFLLSACDTPTREYAGLDAQRVQVGQSLFDVRIKGDKAEAIRVNSEWAPRPEAVMPRARIAIEQASGCRVSRMQGDQVLIEARLTCTDARATRSTEQAYECVYNRLYRGRIEVVCAPGI